MSSTIGMIASRARSLEDYGVGAVIDEEQASEDLGRCMYRWADAELVLELFELGIVCGDVWAPTRLSYADISAVIPSHLREAMRGKSDLNRVVPVTATTAEGPVLLRMRMRLYTYICPFLGRVVTHIQGADN